MNASHWDIYRSYNTTDDATTLVDVAEVLKTKTNDEDELFFLAEALTGIAQRLSRLDTTYPWPDPIPEHWGPKPEHLYARDTTAKDTVVVLFSQRVEEYGPTHGPYTEDEARAVALEILGFDTHDEAEAAGWSFNDNAWEHEAGDAVIITRLSQPPHRER